MTDTVSGNAQSNIEKLAFDTWYGTADRKGTRSIENNINTIADQEERERYKAALRRLVDDYISSPWKSPVPGSGSTFSMSRDSTSAASVKSMIMLREQVLGIDESQAKRDIVSALARYIGVSERAVLDYISGDQVVHGALPVIAITSVLVGLFAKREGVSTDTAIKYGAATAASTILAIEGSSLLVNRKPVSIGDLFSLPSIKGFK